MNQWDCLITACVMGAGVLISYVWLAYKKGNRDLWGGLKGPLFKYWLGTAIVTALSFLFLVINWCFIIDPNFTFMFNELVSDSWHIIFAVLFVFLLSAFSWTFVTLYIPKLTWLPLWITALASLGLFVLTAATREGSVGLSWNVVVATVAGMVLVAHHFIWDAMVWNATWVDKAN